MYTHVVFVNKSVRRVDLFAYHPRLRSAERLREYNNILAYFVQVGLVDITKAGQQVMIYELTRVTHHDKSREASKEQSTRETVSRGTSSNHNCCRYEISHVLLVAPESQCLPSWIENQNGPN